MELKKRWFHSIRKVYETDLLTCPERQGEYFNRIAATVAHLEELSIRDATLTDLHRRVARLRAENPTD